MVVDPQAVDPARLGEPGQLRPAATTPRRGRPCRSSGARVRLHPAMVASRIGGPGTVTVRSGDLDAGRIFGIGSRPRPIGLLGPPKAALIVTSSPATEVLRASQDRAPSSRPCCSPRCRARQRPPSRADAKAEHRAAVIAYWTPARMKAAKPLDITFDAVRGFQRTRAGPAAVAVAAAARRASGRVVDGWRQDAHHDRPRAVHPEAVDYICSGSVVNDGTTRNHAIVLTAGHCAYREHGGPFATNWLFIPEFDTRADVHLRQHDVRLLGRPTPSYVRHGVRHGRRVQHTRRSCTTGASRSSAPAASPRRHSSTPPSASVPDRVQRREQRHTLSAFGYPAAGQVPRQRPRLLPRRDRAGRQQRQHDLVGMPAT